MRALAVVGLLALLVTRNFSAAQPVLWLDTQDVKSGATAGAVENTIALPITVASPNSALELDLSLRSESRL